MINQFFLFLISLIPSNKIKILLLNVFPNISVDNNSKIGYGLILDCRKFRVINSKIGSFNFIKCNDFKLVNSKIANNNLILKINKFNACNYSIIGSHNFILPKKSNNKIYIKMDNSQISSNFRLILSKNLYLGKKVILGGMNTKIIDDIDDAYKSTIFLKNIFVGSNAIIKNGVRINKNIVIGANTLIENHLLSSGKYFSKKINIFN